MNIVVLSSWRSHLLAPTLEALARAALVPAAVLFDGEKDDRSLAIHRSRTEGFASDRSIFDLESMRLPGYFVRDHNSPLSVDLIRSFQADLLVNGGVRRILRRPLLETPRIGVINSHPGILPKYRGCECVEWAIYNDDPVGATCHFMNTEIDAGPVVLSERMPIRRGEPYEAVRARIITHCADVLARGIVRIRNEALSPARMPPVSTDSYFNVMPEPLLEEVKRKLRDGTYKAYED